MNVEHEALRVRVEGVVQGVGFRPFVYRLAREHRLTGWVRNARAGVEIHAEGEPARLRTFLENLRKEAPPAAAVHLVEERSAEPIGAADFTILPSSGAGPPTTLISPDLAVCDDCLGELFTPGDRRFHYPYINCTNCGPRYSIVHSLPYDRSRTTMKDWPMCRDCAVQYEDPADRRFHAQPNACPRCGPGYWLSGPGAEPSRGVEALRAAAALLREGGLLAVKGLGGYHVACDAANEDSVSRLRRRKFRKEKPFALLAKDLETARLCVRLSPEAERLLTAPARPIVLAPARLELPGVAPGNRDLGVMLPATPVQHLLPALGAPALLVMTSANRSSEPIAYRDDDALDRLSEIVDAFLGGEREIARRVDDSVLRVGPTGVATLRRARGCAPAVLARLPWKGPLLAVGADLKNSVALSVDGQAIGSQHLGDLGQFQALESFRETIRDLLAMYRVPPDRLLVAHDAHPQYQSTRFAQSLGQTRIAIQHHRAHIASVLAEREAWDAPVAGFSFDGAGYGDDGAIWGGEVFAGSLREGLGRVAHLRPATLVGGDAAARHPVQAAAGFLVQLEDLPDLLQAPFTFEPRFTLALQMARRGARCHPTTSMGRLFDAVAALLGFTREMTFEGQAAIWLEHQARGEAAATPYPFPDWDFRPLLQSVVADRLAGRPPGEIARAFHEAIAETVAKQAELLWRDRKLEAVVASGGVFQNQLLLQQVHARLEAASIPLWTNHAVSAGDGGISLGQAAMAAVEAGRR